jgi:site-specific recombinase XerD
MSGCKGGCNTSALLCGFVEELQPQGEQRQWIIAALNRLCDYAQGVGKLLCEMGMPEMQGFVHYLYSLEKGEYTADDSHRETHICGLFYAYLLARGCVSANPVQALKQAAIAELMEGIEAAGFGRIEKEEGDEQNIQRGV